ncbi:T9SS type B sorting domain-containing protein [Spirosoma luteolum]
MSLITTPRSCWHPAWPAALLVWWLWGLAQMATAQNLVPNGSFETFRNCPQKDNLLFEAEPWYNPNRATPDFYHRCLDFGQMLLPPHSGQGLARLLFDQNWAEYLGVRLTQPLVADACYYVEFYVATDTPNKYLTETLGAYLSTAPVTRPTTTDMLNARPQLLDRTPKASVGRLNWARIGGIVYARGGEQYLTIGSFNQLPVLLGSYYVFVDDVSVRRITLDLGRDTTLCSRSDRFTLDATTPGAVDYRWTDGSIKPTLQVTSPGRYSVTVVTDCKVLTDSIRIDYALDFDLGRDTTLCDGQTLPLTVPAVAAAAYTWQDQATGPTYRVDRPGLYRVRATQANCVVTDSIRVRYVPPPRLDLGPDQSLCGTQTFTIRPQLADGRFRWLDDHPDPVRTVSHAGVFLATVQNDCATLVDSVRIDYEACECALEAPNSFSPNEDGLNDTFRPVGCGDMTLLSLQILNRWGEVIYETGQEPFRWNGQYRGLPCPPGEYAWRVDYRLTRRRGTTAAQKQGPLLLIR